MRRKFPRCGGHAHRNFPILARLVRTEIGWHAHWLWSNVRVDAEYHSISSSRPWADNLTNLLSHQLKMGKENRRHVRLTKGTESVQVQTEAKLRTKWVWQDILKGILWLFTQVKVLKLATVRMCRSTIQAISWFFSLTSQDFNKILFSSVT